MFFQLLTGTIWQKSVNTAATKVLKSIKDISSAKSRNFTDISRGQLRAPTIQTSVKFCYLSLQSNISSIPLDFSPLNLVRFRILKRSFQSQNYNISVKGYILGAYIWWCSTKIIKEKKSKNLIRNVDCWIFNDLVFWFCCWPILLINCIGYLEYKKKIHVRFSTSCINGKFIGNETCLLL